MYFVDSKLLQKNVITMNYSFKLNFSDSFERDFGRSTALVVL